MQFILSKITNHPLKLYELFWDTSDDTNQARSFTATGPDQVEGRLRRGPLNFPSPSGSTVAGGPE